MERRGRTAASLESEYPIQSSGSRGDSTFSQAVFNLVQAYNNDVKSLKRTIFRLRREREQLLSLVNSLDSDAALRWRNERPEKLNQLSDPAHYDNLQSDGMRFEPKPDIENSAQEDKFTTPPEIKEMACSACLNYWRAKHRSALDHNSAASMLNCIQQTCRHRRINRHKPQPFEGFGTCERTKSEVIDEDKFWTIGIPNTPEAIGPANQLPIEQLADRPRRKRRLQLTDRALYRQTDKSCQNESVPVMVEVVNFPKDEDDDTKNVI
ncbi:hypothetical protein ACOME3_005650 [Neoechinorhynchus agilis]